MRDALTVLEFNQFVGQESQRPPLVSLRRIATSQGCDLRTLQAINFDRSTRTGFVLQSLQPLALVLVAPGCFC